MTLASMYLATNGRDKGRVPCSGARHPVEEVVTPHSGEEPGEMRLEQVGAQLPENPSGMNGSCDSHGSIRITPVGSIPWRTNNKPRLRNGRTLLLRPDRIASPCFWNHIRLCKAMSYAFGFFNRQPSFPCAKGSRNIKSNLQRSL